MCWNSSAVHREPHDFSDVKDQKHCSQGKDVGIQTCDPVPYPGTAVGDDEKATSYTVY